MPASLDKMASLNLENSTCKMHVAHSLLLVWQASDLALRLTHSVTAVCFLSNHTRHHFAVDLQLHLRDLCSLKKLTLFPRWQQVWRILRGWTTSTETCALPTSWLEKVWCVRLLTSVWPGSSRTMNTQQDKVDLQGLCKMWFNKLKSYNINVLIVVNVGMTLYYLYVHTCRNMCLRVSSIQTV